MIPRATYRLQFRNGMDFAAAAGLAPYLARLGISHLYASPLFAARPGSGHGYDVTDFNRFDPALGDAAGFERMVEALHRHGLGLVLDIVPNHMAAAFENRWWRDVLTHGRSSRHAAMFDIDWSRHGGSVLLPVLGRSYAQALRDGELRLRWQDGGAVVCYFDNLFPLAPETLALLPREAARAEGDEIPLPVERLHTLLEAQHYRLAHWRVAAGGLNYRRFFDINDLVGVRVEDPEVFRAVHALTLGLVREGMVDGLRLDHVDGLAEPAAYLRSLRAAVEEARPQADAGAAARFPIWVEKILGPGERLRETWPVEGTTGYEFATLATGLAVVPDGLAALRQAFAGFTGDRRGFAQVAEEAKRFILDLSFAGELGGLVAQAAAIAESGLESRDLPAETLRQALRELLVAMPVYRSYVSVDAAANGGPQGEDLALIGRAAERAAAALGAEGGEALAFLARVLQGRRPDHAAFAVRFQQLSGPLMAKAVEDTGFYRYLPLLALNEVGGEPGAAPADPAAFHAASAERLHRHPHSLLATATHDTKRGEDVRARLALLAERPAAFAALASRWWDAQAPLRAKGGEDGPTAKEAWLLYQTLVGVWPADLAPDAADAGPRLAELCRRLEGYLEKAMREAKERTRWTGPDPAHEAAALAFLRALLDPGRSAAFLSELHALVRELAPAAAVNGLAQLVLKLTVPGVPDIYQGTEFHDFSLVDPDNRRPVDFARRDAALAAAEREAGPLPYPPQSEAAKLAVLQRLLAWRRQHPVLFAEGRYRPVEVMADGGARHLAFARLLPPEALLVCVPLRPLHGVSGQGELFLAGTGLEGFAWRDLLTGRRQGPALRLRTGELLRGFPVAVLAAAAG